MYVFLKNNIAKAKTIELIISILFYFMHNFLHFVIIIVKIKNRKKINNFLLDQMQLNNKKKRMIN